MQYVVGNVDFYHSQLEVNPSVLIPRFASAGAAFGTLIAELVVLIVQYIALKKYIIGMFKNIHFLRLSLALLLSGMISIWVKTLNLGNFAILVLSAILFFGAYGLCLLVMKEELVIEIFNQIIKKVKRKYHKR